ncbi:hypothetical protein HanPI659440_Chr05g0185901 [Helianthus annuus]|nr:hypothetical protein HanPI659440_Chr05g0185901 [Helianthus annuus]
MNQDKPSPLLRAPNFQMSPEVVSDVSKEVADVAGDRRCRRRRLQMSPARPYAKTRRPDRPDPGPTAGLMLKRIYVLNRPGMCSGSRPNRSDRPARSGFENLGKMDGIIN